MSAPSQPVVRHTGADDAAPRPGRPATASSQPSTWSAMAAVYTGQLSRVRAGRAPLLFVATLQSLGILVLLRGVEDHAGDLTRQAIVAGASVLVVAFVALNLLAQYFGTLRASRGLDYYAALPVPPAAVVLGTAASYATFAVPGTVITAIVGTALFGLPLATVWMVLPVVAVTAPALAGLGALLGLALPRPEYATLAGQLGMTIVLFLGIIPAYRLPGALQAIRAVVPSTYGVDALAAALHPHPAWGSIAWHLAVCVAVAVLACAAATWAFRHAVRH